MAYSNSSRKGKEFLRYLTDLSVRATLFAPNDSGLRENEVRFLFFFPSSFQYRLLNSHDGFLYPGEIILVQHDFCVTPHSLNCASERGKFIIYISFP